MFDKILIANRGEIAVRIMRTARRMGIKTVAVYSEADTNALHVKEADEAVYIGPSPSSQSYLNTDAIMAAIDQTGAQAVHPGYGFLSEKEAFAKAVRRMGAVFIGPPPDAVRLMGDKIESKKIAQQAGVSTVPGRLAPVQGLEEAKRVVSEIGYPVIIKAAAGGGGKGMRIARDDKELEQGIEMAASEAQSSFKDSRVFIEKFFEDPRHIEIQILADRYGNVISLGERECSIQRRHQKVIEEAPSVFLDAAMRKEMGDQSIALAKAVNYVSAGTVEFIVDKHGKFYFLEMNTRLQVEHRVTELVTGLDLVEQMIRIAYGERLQLTQEEVKIDGWAMEARVYAEDPARGFLPSTGRLIRYAEPVLEAEAGTSLVIDTGVYEGGEVSMFYDPMIAKVCTHTPTREGTIAAMRQALGNFVIRGIAHNISFLDAVLAHDRFAKGDLSTHFIEQEYPRGYSGAELDSEAKEVFLGTIVFCHLREVERAAQTSGQLPGRQLAIGSRWVANIAGENYPIYVRKREFGYDVSYGKGMIEVRSSWKLGRRLFQGTVNDRPVSVKLRPLAEGCFLSYAGAEGRAVMRTPRVAELAVYMPQRQNGEHAQNATAPIAGLITSVRVSEGDKVKAGQELFTIEAMKMENLITAGHEAVVKKIHVAPPASVAANQIIIEFDKAS